MEKETKKKKDNVFIRTFSIFEKETPLERFLPAIMLLRGFDVILTAIFGLFLGIFAPIIIMIGTEDPEYAGDISTTVWLVSSILYTVGIFILMLGNTKTAAIIHIVASIGTLVTFFRYTELFKDIPDNNGPVLLYMPCLGITALTVTITLLTNLPKYIQRKRREKNKKSPSIFDD